jgi:hypothetical protein
MRTTIFSQDHTFQLLSDHLVQKGPSFPHPIDVYINASKNEVTIHATEKKKEKDEVQHIDLSEDISNGMILTLPRNISHSTQETKVSTLSTSAKPRLVKLSIRPKGERTFTVVGSQGHRLRRQSRNRGSCRRGCANCWEAAARYAHLDVIGTGGSTVVIHTMKAG